MKDADRAPTPAVNAGAITLSTIVFLPLAERARLARYGSGAGTETGTGSDTELDSGSGDAFTGADAATAGPESVWTTTASPVRGRSALVSASA